MRHRFFFQAEDGIRDIGVTGVQTCALPISKLALDQDQRIASVKVILATASSNLALIRTLLDDFRSEAAYEIHFTLFCFMADRKSTRLNSSHANISYAVFCLKKKTNTNHKVR